MYNVNLIFPEKYETIFGPVEVELPFLPRADESFSFNNVEFIVMGVSWVVEKHDLKDASGVFVFLEELELPPEEENQPGTIENVFSDA